MKISLELEDKKIVSTKIDGKEMIKKNLKTYKDIVPYVDALLETDKWVVVGKDEINGISKRKKRKNKKPKKIDIIVQKIKTIGRETGTVSYHTGIAIVKEVCGKIKTTTAEWYFQKAMGIILKHDPLLWSKSNKGRKKEYYFDINKDREFLDKATGLEDVRAKNH